MNIIKFRDEIHPTSELFNDKLSGKYAIAIQYKYIYPIETDGLSREDYIDLECGLVLPIEGDYMDYADVSSYISIETVTYDHNKLNKLISYNELYDKGVALDETKQYRKLIAGFLLAGIPSELLSQQEHILLNYYANDMVDDTIITLNGISSPVLYTAPDIRLSCECNCNKNNGSTYTYMNNSFECMTPIQIYKLQVYQHMISNFSNYKFWQKCDILLLENIIKYTQAVIDYNLPISNENNVVHIDYSCAANDINTIQLHLQGILSGFIDSLQHIIDNTISGNKTSVSCNLEEFAKIYELLRW